MSLTFIPSNIFKNGCMLCANENVSIFNPYGKTTVEYTVESSYQTGNSFLFVKDTSIEVRILLNILITNSNSYIYRSRLYRFYKL